MKKFVSVRTRLARRIFKLSVWLTPAPEDTPEYKLLPDELKTRTDAAVEVDDQSPTWQQEQHGNVVIVEPDLMFQHRRGKL